MGKIQRLRDRGAAKYFQGREEILLEFKKLLADSGKPKGGTILLVQGPPGVGKTALLAKCWDEAEERGWEVAEIDPEDLWNPDELRKTLGLPPQERKVGKTTGWGLDKIFNFFRKIETEINAPLDTPADILKLKKAPVLLVLDEAQHLGEDGGVPEEHHKSVRTLLKRIHNGRLGRPVILLAGGLGMTFQAFQALGISRMAEGCKFDMEPLEEEEERDVIKDWLKKEGEAKGGTTDWVDAISQETHCWPQHIHSYSTCAAHILKQSGGEMTEERLRIVMEKGRAKRRQYYEDRLSGFTAKERRSLARILAGSSETSEVEQEEAVEQLDREYGVGHGEEIFFRAVRRGVFYFNKALGSYSVPIPSLRNFIVKNFPPKEISEQRLESQDQSEPEQLPEADPEKEGSPKEPEIHKTDRLSPEKEEGKESTIPKSGKENSGQDTPQSRDTSRRDQGTDMGMER